MNQSGKKVPEDQKNPLEWTVFGVSLVVLLTLFTYLVYQVYQQEATPPELVIEYQPEPSAHAPFRYHVVVHNQGGSTAEGVQLAFDLMKDTVVVETAALQIQFAPQSSQREGWVIFSRDPATADSIVSRVLGYNKP